MPLAYMPVFAAFLEAPASDETAALRGVVRAVASAVLRLRPDHPDVEDCASETLRRAIEGQTRLRQGQPRRPWVIGIARHVALDMMRARKRTRLGDDFADAKNSPDDPSSWMDRLPDSSPGPHELLERAEGRAKLERAVAELPRGMQTALKKFHIEGKSYQQIAEEMSLPLGTVATWVTRGRKSVAERLGVGGSVE
jgi:RNA polymerase sigma factor (sigma-70 family)